MIDPIPPNNPLFEVLHNECKAKRKRSLNKAKLRPPYRGDVKFCAWCNNQPVAYGRHKYCSQRCVDSSTMYLYPTCDLSIEYMLNRQQCLCNLCGYAFKECIQQRIDRITSIFGVDSKRVKDFLKLPLYTQILRSRDFLPPDRLMEVDHIIPVAMGGDVLTLSNVQVLCKDCHKSKTIIDHRNIRLSKGKIL